MLAAHWERLLSIDSLFVGLCLLGVILVLIFSKETRSLLWQALRHPRSNSYYDPDTKTWSTEPPPYKDDEELKQMLYEDRRETEQAHGPGAWDVADVLAVIREREQKDIKKPKRSHKKDIPQSVLDHADPDLSSFDDGKQR